MTPNPLARTTAAAALLIVPVAAEIAFPERFDGAAGNVAFAAAQLLGWLLIGSVVRPAPPGPARRARFGRRAVLVGIACQVAFAAVYGVTSFDAEPLEASFFLFLLGFLALTVGGLSWGSALARSAGRRTAGWGLVATAVLGLLAVMVGVDPFHDIFLLSSYAAWPVVGHGLTRSPGQRTADPVGVAMRARL
jgi:hypothetical protein